MKRYLILGASSEVGMAYMRKLNTTDPGAEVIACYRTESDEFKNACDLCSELSVKTKKVDMAVPEQVDSLIEEISGQESCPTHIVHLAAAPFEYMRIKQWDENRAKEEMEITLFAFAKICKECLPVMAKNKYGKVVAMLTAYTLGTPPKFMSDYVAGKYALLGYIKAAASEYAGKININAVSPNMMETKFLEKIDEKIVAMAADSSAMKRNIKVEETVDAISFLMSDEASYVSGVNFNLSGGDFM